MRPKKTGKGDEHKFSAVTSADLERESIVEDFIVAHLAEWQAKGWVPEMRIEPGAKTDEPIRTRGWSYWHHLFNPRQLLILGLIKKSMLASKLHADAWIFFAKSIDWNSRISRWNPRWEKTENVFYNQALNTFYNYGTRSWGFLARTLAVDTASFPLPTVRCEVNCQDASSVSVSTDVYITDPPYGDAINYDEILDFFIAWLRKDPPPEFADWVWDSRRSLAIKGEGEDFRRGMVAAYKRMTECMPDNGIQVIMFTHQSGSIWADMANIVWASGLQVTAAWYVVTETESALREGSYVKGTVLLVVRKRKGLLKTTRDELAWEIQEEVEKQVKTLTGLNQEAKGLYRDENVFEDADIQMAGYAAALRALTKYAIIDGRDMTVEAIRPRVKGETTIVDDLISFAVDTANQCLVPEGLAKAKWDKLSGAERFYLKMLDLEARGAKTLDNYQNFAKAFKVRDFKPLMSSYKANDARLIDFRKSNGTVHLVTGPRQI
jgi:putative DNA methylase